MKCQKKGCNETRDVQYLIIKNTKSWIPKKNRIKPQYIKEYYCQKHLRMRILMLEFMNMANKFRKDLEGWW